jgi:hypothetical protein
MIALLLIYLLCFTICVVYFIKEPMCERGWDGDIVTYGNLITMIFLAIVPLINIFTASFIFGTLIDNAIDNFKFLSKPFKVLK